MEFDLSTLQPKERASFALRGLYEAAGCRKYHMGRFEEYGLYQENRSFLSSEQVITFTDLDGIYGRFPEKVCGKMWQSCFRTRYSLPTPCGPI